jgi:hypothetical protein
MEDLSSVFICFRAIAIKGEGEIQRVRHRGLERVKDEQKEKGESKEETQEDATGRKAEKEKRGRTWEIACSFNEQYDLEK